MKTIIKYLRLPLSFDTDAMLDEVTKLANASLPHYNQNDYTGSWTAIPLRSINGDIAQAFAHPGQQFENTVYLEQCPAIKNTIDSFQCEKLAIRILNLKPNATIKTHTDQGLCYEEGEIRLHIPLQTNTQVDFILDDEPLYPKVGECWYMNFNLNHNLANNGDNDRIHLVIDCIVNDWVHQLFDNVVEENIKTIEVENGMSDDEKRSMIQQLRLIGTEVALELATKTEQELLNK